MKFAHSRISLDAAVDNRFDLCPWKVALAGINVLHTLVPRWNLLSPDAVLEVVVDLLAGFNRSAIFFGLLRKDLITHFAIRSLEKDGLIIPSRDSQLAYKSFR